MCKIMDENVCHHTVMNQIDNPLRKNEIISKINGVMCHIDLIDSKLNDKYNDHLQKIAFYEKILLDSNNNYSRIIKNLI